MPDLTIRILYLSLRLLLVLDFCLADADVVVAALCSTQGAQNVDMQISHTSLANCFRKPLLSSTALFYRYSHASGIAVTIFVSIY